jgi:uncharacterized protein (DUF433 family)
MPNSREVMDMQNLDRIELNPRICGGKPVIKGIRIPVSVILERIADNEPWESVLRAYPELHKEDRLRPVISDQ